MNKTQAAEQAAMELTKKLANEGKLLEAGFAAFVHLVIAEDAPAVQIEAMRLAFMAGAEHLFSSIVNILDPGDEPTRAELRRMDLIQREINEWRSRISERVHPSQGRG